MMSSPMPAGPKWILSGKYSSPGCVAVLVMSSGFGVMPVSVEIISLSRVVPPPETVIPPVITV